MPSRPREGGNPYPPRPNLFDDGATSLKTRLMSPCFRGEDDVANTFRVIRRIHHVSFPDALVSISASAIRTPRPRVQTKTGLRSIAANCPSVATTKSEKRTQQSIRA